MYKYVDKFPKAVGEKLNVNEEDLKTVKDAKVWSSLFA